VGGEGAGQAAGFNWAELVVVADQDEFGVGRLDCVDQGGEVGGGQHGGLVHDHHFARPESAVSVAVAVGVVEELGHGVGGDPCFFGQDAGRDGGDGQAPHQGAVDGPGGAGGADHAGLAGAGRADHADD